MRKTKRWRKRRHEVNWIKKGEITFNSLFMHSCPLAIDMKLSLTNDQLLNSAMKLVRNYTLSLSLHVVSSIITKYLFIIFFFFYSFLLLGFYFRKKIQFYSNSEVTMWEKIRKISLSIVTKFKSVKLIFFVDDKREFICTCDVLDWESWGKN